MGGTCGSWALRPKRSWREYNDQENGIKNENNEKKGIIMKKVLANRPI